MRLYSLWKPENGLLVPVFFFANRFQFFIPIMWIATATRGMALTRRSLSQVNFVHHYRRRLSTSPIAKATMSNSEVSILQLEAPHTYPLLPSKQAFIHLFHPSHSYTSLIIITQGLRRNLSGPRSHRRIWHCWFCLHGCPRSLSRCWHPLHSCCTRARRCSHGWHVYFA